VSNTCEIDCTNVELLGKGSISQKLGIAFGLQMADKLGKFADAAESFSMTLSYRQIVVTNGEL
jgi:hypothetical protein